MKPSTASSKIMDTSTLIMFIVAAVMLAGVYLKAPESAAHGLKSGAALLIAVLPRMIAAFLIAGLIQVIVPQELIAVWMGKSPAGAAFSSRWGWARSLRAAP